MKYFPLLALLLSFSAIGLVGPLYAQSIGGGGSNTNTNTGSSSSSSSSSGTSSLDSAAETPTFQGDWGTGSSSFVGRPDSGAPFIGREQSFDASTSINNRSTSTARSTTTRRTSTARTTRRTTTSRTSSSTNSRSVRAATTTDFAFARVELDRRTTEIHTRIARMPNLQMGPDRVDIQITKTPQGNVATVSGSVPTERERKLLQQLMLLEPGIDKVDNRLIVDTNRLELP